MIRSKAILLVLLSFSALLRADFLFWLDSPAGRNNPFDPKNPNSASNLPLAPIASPMPTVTAVPGSLLVKIYDVSGAPVPGKWVQVNNDSAGAQQSNSVGQVNFTGVSFPAIVHVFPGIVGMPGAISVMGVTGPSFEFWSIGGTSPTGTTVTCNVTHADTSSVGYYFSTFDSSGTSTGGQGSGGSGNPAVFDFPGQTLGEIAHFMAFKFDSLSGLFTEAGFVPPTPIVSNANLNLTLGATGWTSATIPVTVTESLVGGTYYLRAYGGASVSSHYTLPVMSTYSMTGTATTFGPILFPSPLGFTSIELSKNTMLSPTESHSQYVKITGTAIPANLNFVMPPKLQWSRSPTAMDPHLTVIDTDPVKPNLMVLYSNDWYVASIEPAQGQGLDIQFPTLPAAVTLTPFSGPGPFSAMVVSWACVGPAPQSVYHSLPYIVRGNYASIQY